MIPSLSDTLPVGKQISPISGRPPGYFSTPEVAAALGEKVARYWYHRQPDFDAEVGVGDDLRAYPIRQREAASSFGPGAGDWNYVWLSSSPIYSSETEYVVDLTRLENNDLRFTGQAEGHLLHHGDIPARAVVFGPDRDVGIYIDESDVPKKLPAEFKRFWASAGLKPLEIMNPRQRGQMLMFAVDNRIPFPRIVYKIGVRYTTPVGELWVDAQDHSWLAGHDEWQVGIPEGATSASIRVGLVPIEVAFDEKQVVLA
jgi:hypothetical protein